MTKSTPLRVTIASPPDREFHVAEIIEEIGNAAYIRAEINQESEDLMIEFYPNPDGTPVTIEYDRFMEALQRGKERLLNFDPRKSPFFKETDFEE